jgi:hypothetical protein
MPRPGRAPDRDWLHWAGQRLTGIGEVDAVTILPLVERVTSDPGLHGEPGLSYLITAGPPRLLFDTGLNLRGRAESARPARGRLVRARQHPWADRQFASRGAHPSSQAGHLTAIPGPAAPPQVPSGDPASRPSPRCAAAVG